MTMQTTDMAELRRVLEVVDQSHQNETWFHTLEARKIEEVELHDHFRAPEQQTHRDSSEPNAGLYKTAGKSLETRDAWVRQHAAGKVILDYACGNGGMTLLAAQSGAALAIGIDISPVSIAGCRQLARQRGVEQTTCFIVTDCEDTKIPSESVDIIIASGCLHHMDLTRAFPEMHRILKPGGRVFALEALAYNPLIQLYRRLTPAFRSKFETEHILSLASLRLAGRWFNVTHIDYFHLTSIATAPLMKTRFFTPALAVANLIDSAILKIPVIQNLAWIFTFELTKDR